MEVKSDFSWTEIGILVGIKNCENLKRITINEIAIQIKINRCHPTFYRVLSYLIDTKIMSLIEVIGTVKFFKINYKEIRDLLDEQVLVNKILDDYLKKDHSFVW